MLFRSLDTVLYFTSSFSPAPEKSLCIGAAAFSSLAASYINFYQGEKFVILPGFNEKEDKLAKKKLEELYPDKEIIQIDSKEILLGGGNIHCITMQIPYQKEFNKHNEN